MGWGYSNSIFFFFYSEASELFNTLASTKQRNPIGWIPLFTDQKISMLRNSIITLADEPLSYQASLPSSASVGTGVGNVLTLMLASGVPFTRRERSRQRYPKASPPPYYTSYSHVPLTSHAYTLNIHMPFMYIYTKAEKSRNPIIHTHMESLRFHSCPHQTSWRIC